MMKYSPNKKIYSDANEYPITSQKLIFQLSQINYKWTYQYSLLFKREYEEWVCLRLSVYFPSLSTITYISTTAFTGPLSARPRMKSRHEPCFSPTLTRWPLVPVSWARTPGRHCGDPSQPPPRDYRSPLAAGEGERRGGAAAQLIGGGNDARWRWRGGRS